MACGTYPPSPRSGQRIRRIRENTLWQKAGPYNSNPLRGRPRSGTSVKDTAFAIADLYKAPSSIKNGKSHIHEIRRSTHHILYNGRFGGWLPVRLRCPYLRTIRSRCKSLYFGLELEVDSHVDRSICRTNPESDPRETSSDPPSGAQSTPAGSSCSADCSQCAAGS